MLEKLGDALKGTLKKIASAIFVDDTLLNELIKDIQRALLQADVNVKLVFQLTQKIKERGQKDNNHHARRIIRIRKNDDHRKTIKVLQKTRKKHRSHRIRHTQTSSNAPIGNCCGTSRSHSIRRQHDKRPTTNHQTIQRRRNQKRHDHHRHRRKRRTQRRTHTRNQKSKRRNTTRPHHTRHKRRHRTNSTTTSNSIP